MSGIYPPPLKTCASILATSLALTACGGGGGGSSPDSGPAPQSGMQYVGVETAAVIADDNAMDIFQTFRTLVGPPPVDYDPDTDDTVFALTSALNGFSNFIVNLKNGQQLQTGTRNCGDSGQVRTSASNSPPRFEAEFYNCVEEGVTMDGTMILTEASAMANNSNAAGHTPIRFQFTDLTLSDPDNYFAYNGTLECVYAGFPDAQFTGLGNHTAPNGTHCRSGQLVIQDINRKIFQLQNVEFAETTWRGGLRGDPGFNLLTTDARTYSISGRFYHPDYGYVDIADSAGEWPMAYLDVLTTFGMPSGLAGIRLSGDNSSMQVYQIPPDPNNPSIEARSLLLINGSTPETADAALDITL
jgi:hypothetical protein